MGYEIRTEIEIDAPPEHVWAVLSDFAGYPSWNPFIQEIEGKIILGSRLQVKVRQPGGRAMRFEPRVVVADPGRTFAWLGRLGFRGLFDGEHHFDLQPVGENRTRLVQSERFSGMLVPLLRRTLDTKARAGFETMNHSLKARVEQREHGHRLEGL